MGYAQGNLFPFHEEMRKIKETEEAVCYSPDVSKFTGGICVSFFFFFFFFLIFALGKISHLC